MEKQRGRQAAREREIARDTEKVDGGERKTQTETEGDREESRDIK